MVVRDRIVSSWLCECDCGEKVIKSRQRLYSKKCPVTSCGCASIRKKRPVNLIGIKSGKLSPIKKVGLNKWGYSLWLCKCDCGKETIKSHTYLLDKKSTINSCGCEYKHKIKPENDLTGKIFGKLTVIRHDDKTDAHFNHYWLCKCECGKETIVGGGHLKSGNGSTKSCGCLAHEKSLQGLLPGEAGFNSLIQSYRSSAKERGLKFDLSEEEFKELVTKDCIYCGIPPLNIKKKESSHSIFLYNGIDRVDNLEGYTKENCVPCCTKCNRMKFNYSKSEFLAHCILIDTFQDSKKRLFS